MGSRADSLSSLIEDSEWSRGVSGSHSDDLLSPTASAGDTSDQQSPGITADMLSTSDLLQQIKALTLKAETDF
jgi:hypothetical protein